MKFRPLGDRVLVKRVEEELRAATLQAQAASEAKGRLLSGISHELRTPLNAILGFAQLMRMDCDDESQSEAAEYLDEILLASRHLNQLLGEILEWSSLQNEPAQLELQAVEARREAGLTPCQGKMRARLPHENAPDLENGTVGINLDQPTAGAAFEDKAARLAARARVAVGSAQQ